MSYIIVGIPFIVDCAVSTANNESMMSDSPRSMQSDVVTFYVDNAKRLSFDAESVDGAYHSYHRIGFAEHKIPKPMMIDDDQWKWSNTWVHEENGYYLHFYQHVFQRKSLWRIVSHETETVFETQVSEQSLPGSDHHSFPNIVEVHYKSDRQLKRLVDGKRCGQIIRFKQAQAAEKKESARQPRTRRYKPSKPKPIGPLPYWRKRPKKTQ